MSVLIVGGGIGGLCLAAALARRGIACEIVEREPAWTTVGAGISFYPNGVRALNRLGLGEAVVSAGAKIEQVRTCSRDGVVVSEFPGECWEGIGQTFAIHRAALQQVLLDAIGGVPVHMDATVASLLDRGDAVDVTLTNGSSVTAALVVGADGIRSRVRDLCIGRLQPRYVGQMYWRGAVEHDLVDTATMLFDKDRFVALLPLGSGTTYVALQQHSPQPFVDASLDRFADFGGPTPPAIEMLRADPNLHFGPAEEVERDEWRSGRVLLIGDAAHACSPTLAQGGSLAIEDAVVLAELLASPLSIDGALDEFVARRQPRAQWVRARTHHQIELLNAGAPHEHLARGMRETYARLAEEI
ncbi:MAG TPA: FAD-dependent monooxygenase [Acidimicrobiales bacterium]|nr:FAD-dependent monooxygenase [Acidimicrobiales bacterium]